MGNAAGLWQAIDPYSRFLLTCHVRPDVDAVGSEIALALFLEKLGKTAWIANDAGLVERYRFLPQWQRVGIWGPGDSNSHDAVMCLDAPDIGRVGAAAESAREKPLLIVDHHPYENKSADFAWVDPQASSTGEMLYEFMMMRRELVDAEIATCLYAAMMTDTGRFAFANTSARTLEVAADLARLGAVPADIAGAYYEDVNDSFMRILGTTASAIRRAAGGEVAYATLSAGDFEQAGAGQEAATELAELPRRLSGVRIGALIRELAGGAKVSLRSKGEVNVKEIAEHFGGGGHTKAAGFFLELPLAEAEIVVVKFLEDFLKARKS
ncbi:MAG: DHH family phosphoesterase [Planctomycetota bacterium]